MRRWWLAATCVVVVACTGGEPEGGPDTGAGGPITTIGRATAAEVPLDVGQCGVVAVVRAGVAIDPAAIAFVGCEQPHDLEVAVVFEYPASPAIPFPGTTVVDAYATDQCIDRFEDYVGVAYEASRLDVTIVAPGSAGWEAGDRRVACLVYDSDFARLTATVRNSGL
jgi:hypothetical protein